MSPFFVIWSWTTIFLPCAFWKRDIVLIKKLWHHVNGIINESTLWIPPFVTISAFFLLLLLLVLVFARIRNPIWRFGILLLLLLLLLQIFGFLIAFGLILNSCNKGLILTIFEVTHLHQLVFLLSQWLYEVFQRWNPPILSCEHARVECWHKHWIL